MNRPSTRRDFLRAGITVGGLAGLGDVGFLSQLPRVAAAEVKRPLAAPLQADVEPVVRLLEETPRDQLLEAVAHRIRDGLSYQHVLAALQLAGVRNIQPRPSVGFKFHAVLVVNSAHLASMNSPEEYRWLPIFWALDHFKQAQADDVREGDWTMQPVDEARVPAKDKALAALVDALNQWDADAADVAAAGAARVASPEEVYQTLYRFGARDFRDIGHKAIFVANSQRTLERIGPEHLEPILRSLAYALVKYDGENPARADHEADRPWRHNLELAQQFPADWKQGQPDEGATQELLTALRTASADESCRQVVELLKRKVNPQSIWDALFLGSAELLARQPGIVPLHSVTSTNALHYAYQAARDDQTQRLLLLQNAAFVPLFREATRSRGGKLPEWRINDAFGADSKQTAPASVDEIFAAVSDNRADGAQQAFAWLVASGDPKPLIDRAQLLVFFKGSNSHDYKYSSAVLEDWEHVSPQYRNQYLAACMYQLRGSGGPDNKLVERTRAAFAG
ncbi:MAG: hypothetical protein K1X71_21025 [Pirellulales bacterium]|nr:hypothetical protein [Pirellulales bacterium]